MFNLISTDRKELRDAFDFVEGTGFFHCSEYQKTIYSIRSAYRVLDYGYNENSATTNSVTTIYGKGGWTRYGVRSNGDVYFSEYHSSPEQLQKAKVIGFEIV